MRIYEHRGFPNPTRVRIAAAERGLDRQIDYVAVDVPGGEHRRPEFLLKNPSGTVPVLELDDGTTISESTAITEYLDHLDGTPTLTGSTPRERACIHMLQRRVESGLLDAVAAYFHHATPGLGPDLETHQNQAWGEHQRERAIETLHHLDGLLATRPYIAGEEFSVADITAIAGLQFADAVGIPVPEDLAHLRRWYAQVQSRPSLLAA